MTSAFRHHDQRPPQINSPLYLQLIDEWIGLNRLRSSELAVRRWGQLEPALLHHIRPADVVDGIDRATGAVQDQMLLALIRLAQAGHQLAGRVVLQAMLPKLGRMTNRTNGNSSDSAWIEDRRHIVVAEFWDVLAHYPAGRRTTKVAGNLALDTLHRVTSPGARKPDRPIDPAQLPEPDRQCHAMDDLPVPGHLTADSGLDEVLSWAIDHHAISKADAQLLTRVYLPHAGRWGTADVAREMGCTSAAIRQRCSRARRVLVDAVQAHLRAGELMDAA